MSTKIKGEIGILFIYDSAAYRPIACLTSNSLATTVSVIESQTKCAPGIIEKQGGTFSYMIDAEGEYIDTTSVGGDVAKASHDYLFAKQQLKNLVTWKLVTGVTNQIYYGSAIISDLNLDQGSGDDLSTFTLTLDGSGLIVEVDPHA
jgi:predicted secreted protein